MSDGVVHAAGCAVWRVGPDDRIEVLVVHRPRYDDWSLPKGKRDPGESDLACAVREVQEETGVTGEVGPELPSTSYEVDAGRKVVRYWAMRATGGSFEPNHEVDEVRWVTPGEATRLLDHDHDRRVIEALLPATRRA